MASLYELFGSEKTLEDEGAWIPVEDCKFSDGSSPEFRVRRIGGTNCPFNREVERLLAPARKRMRKLSRNSSGELNSDLTTKATKDAFVSVALVGWRNFPKNLKADGEKGELLEYSSENAKGLMDQMPELCAYLMNEAVEKKYYQDEDKEGDAKNL